jgi:hypothetical protein
VTSPKTLEFFLDFLEFSSETMLDYMQDDIDKLSMNVLEVILKHPKIDLSYQDYKFVRMIHRHFDAA